MSEQNLSNSLSPYAMNLSISSGRRIILRGGRGMYEAPSKAAGVHSRIAMKAAGFEYINIEDAARCQKCGLEVAGWRSDMNPFTIHKQRTPTCSFVVSMLPPLTSMTMMTANLCTIPSALAEEGQPLKRLKTDTPAVTRTLNRLIEVNSLKQIRKRTFSHWPHRSSPSAAQMIIAGFFNCNVGDRVICIYCNIICQQWTPNSDDPCEVHKTLSPKCPYVIAMSAAPQIPSPSPEQKSSSGKDLRQTTAVNQKYAEDGTRLASFNTCSNVDLPSVADLVNAGFFYTGTGSIVTCFYCNGSLQNWGTNDNPMIEHARWFPHCAYAKQLCGDELHRKIQESERAQQEKANKKDTKCVLETGFNGSNAERLSIPDKDLAALVAVRLGLPASRSAAVGTLKLSIIKKCWEDQLRIKGDDFATDSDLLMACTILQKQLKHIDGKKENIIVPSVAMKKIRDQKSAGAIFPQTQAQKMQPTNPCVLCKEEERCLVCLPCGHLITCIPCGEVYRACPTCYVEIAAFVRIYN